jgi:hypothetical protein
MWAQLFQHSLASARPMWATLGGAKFSHWVQDLEWRRPCERNQLFRRARESAYQRLVRLEMEMTDTLIVSAAIVAVIFVGLFVGHQSASAWPHPVWLGIFALCGIAAIALGTRLVRLKLELHQLCIATNGGFAAEPELSRVRKESQGAAV